MLKIKVYPYIPSLVLAFFVGCNFLHSQTPFICKDQAFGLLNGTFEFVELIVSPSNSAINVSSINANIGVSINAMGYRKTDDLIYGIEPLNHNLYRVDAVGSVVSLTTLNLQNGLSFLAGDVDPSGQYLYAIGSSNGFDEVIVKINLESGIFNVQSISLNGTTSISDIAFDPYTNRLFGFDSESRSIVFINVNNGGITFLAEIGIDKNIESLYFDSFGDLWAYGTAIDGVASALFSINKLTGVEKFETSGQTNSISDGASCPFSVEVRNQVYPKITFPCSEVEYVFTIANNSGSTQNGIDFEHKLPEGCNYLSILQNPFGGTVAPGTTSDLLRISGLSIVPGIDSIVVLVEVGDVPGGDYKSQASLDNLPETLGNTRISDDPKSIVKNDSTTLEVNRIEEDSLFYTTFLCLGESVLLDGSAYGNNLLWSTGSTSQSLSITHEGEYTLEASSGCQSVVITFDVTVASCPYTISVYHEIIPQEALACNEIVYRFIINNDSGLRRDGIHFVDYLQDGFSFVDFLDNPFGGNLEANLAPNEIKIENMSLPLGRDTLDILVAVGDIVPGEYKNRAKIYNLPPLIGTIRFSNDLNVAGKDSTSVMILGVEEDVFVEKLICANEPLVLDGSSFGLNFLWENGSTEDSIFVYEPGEYLLTLTGGCEPGYVFFNVVEGDPIRVDIPESIVEIHLGEDFRLAPIIDNSGDTLMIEWTDPLGNTLSCLDCLEPLALPLENTVYKIVTSNGVCSDSDLVEFIIDKERKVYAPNVFTPNFDGVNDYFFIQSPDFGIVRSLVVIDRWGIPVFKTENVEINDFSSGWNGQLKGNESNAGVYLWYAEIEFLDGLSKQFSGDVTLLK